MRSLIIASLSAVVVLSSCSVYREGQTPDDVYFSPGRSNQQAAYVDATDGRNDGKRYEDERTYSGYDDYATSDDRWLMMRVRNRYRWSYFDDYNYYNPYSFGYNGWGGWGGYGGYGYGGGLGYGMGFGYPGISLGFGWGGSYDPFYSSYYWNSYYNPYYPKVIVVNPKNDPAGYNRIRNFNLNTYNNRSYNNSRSVLNPNTNGRQGYNNSNNNRSLGNSFRRLFSNSNNSTVTPRNSNESYRPSQDRPARVYSPNNNSNNSSYSPRVSGGSSNSGGSSGSGSSSGSRPSRR
jgi:hypothetical protein